MRKLFNVTYELISEESAEYGESADNGFEAIDVTLREALDYVTQTRTCHCGGVVAVEASCSDNRQASWITVYNGMEFLTGFHENRSIHFPDNITASSRARLCRLVERQSIG